MTDDYPASDPVGTVRVFPRWQDENHPREFAIRWCSSIDRDEKYPWLILESEGPQRLTNASVEGCERITFEQAMRELAAGATESEQPDVSTASLKKEEGSVFPNLGPLNRESP